MRHRPRNRAAVSIAVVVMASGVVGSSTSGAAERTGFRALSGPAAAAFALPGDVELARSFDLSAYGLRYERYQQRFGPAAARVLGGQLSVYRDAAGIRAVTGSHYPAITPTNRISVTATQARERSEQELGRQGERTTELWIDPLRGGYQWQVETRRFGFRRLHVIEAQTGQVLQRLDLLATDHGLGVKGDTKSLAGLTQLVGSTSLCTGSHHELVSADGRQTTLDARNGTLFLYPTCDADDHWVLPGRSSPGQPALVDAQFYANTTDDYYRQRHGFDWLACYPGGPFDGPGMRSAAHIGASYNNAFWDGRYTAYGDGDGITFREFSGGLDVVAHEHTHGVTDCTSSLVYSGESGALNEAFSDMLAAAAEFFHVGESPDYLVGEDIYLPSDPDGAGFRNMTDPEEDTDPDHYAERYTGTADNGGVHTNSGIPNHAFFLLAEGGPNASCLAPATHSSAHCTDGDTDDGVVVTGIGREAAERITFLAYVGLPADATMCNARAAVEAQAAALYGAGSQAVTSAHDAYVAVGLTDEVCGFTPPPPPTNTPPTAVTVDATTPSATPVTLTLGGADAETCQLVFEIVSQPSDGGLGGITDQACTAGSPNTDAATVTYTPSPGFAGSDSFTYSVRDGEGATATATATVVVEPVATPTTMHVGDLDGTSSANKRGWQARVDVLVHDGNEGLVPGATVTGSWSNGAKGTGTCTTNGAGACSVTKNVASKSATAKFTVTGITHATLDYQPGADHDDDGDSSGTSIIVPAP